TEDEDKRKIAIAPDQIDIYAGSTNFKGGKRIKVKRVIVHPQFESDTFNHDIALLELADSAGNGTAPIALATPQIEAAVAGVGKTVIAAGWGESEAGDRLQDLRHVEMDVLDSATCNTNIINFRKANSLAAWAKTAQIQFALSDAVTKQVRGLVENNAGR